MILTGVSSIVIGDPDNSFAVTCSANKPLADTPTCTKNADGNFEIKNAYEKEITSGTQLRFRITPIKNP
jgi:hypothetical protein